METLTTAVEIVVPADDWEATVKFYEEVLEAEADRSQSLKAIFRPEEFELHFICSHQGPVLNQLIKNTYYSKASSKDDAEAQYEKLKKLPGAKKYIEFQTITVVSNTICRPVGQGYTVIALGSVEIPNPRTVTTNILGAIHNPNF
ncbi:hypothetical protein GCM10022408_01510 [Hymenobacter fastidiosus]|uniref:VOC family protein n=1 Tax=Hymenobacter fastidiosus TaxID=486264 RepID=A0ABP7RA73_9BACT